MRFNGFSSEAFRFLFELSFNNNTEWFEQNRQRYEDFVKLPTRALAAELMPTALVVDPDYNQNLNSVVSRIRRDTRFTKDKSPYRDHLWIGFRRPKTSISDGFTLWFEFSPRGYTYGAGFYSAEPDFMNAYRKKILAEPSSFLELAQELVRLGFVYEADPYKRDHFPDAISEIKPYINVRSFAWCKRINSVADLLEPSDIAEKLSSDFLKLKPMNTFVQSILSYSN